MRGQLAQFHGLDDSLMIPLEGKLLIHPEVKESFLQLQLAAKEENIALRAISAYRSYSRQLQIWNRKAKGEVPLYDRKGLVVDGHSLSGQERVKMILYWTALPGFSRHHWGSELDVYDANCKSDPQLLPEEYSDGGPYYLLRKFLQERANDFSFFHPYQGTNSGEGVAPEPWHIGHLKVGEDYQKYLSLEEMVDFLSSRREEILLSESVLEQAQFIFNSFLSPRSN